MRRLILLTALAATLTLFSGCPVETRNAPVPPSPAAPETPSVEPAPPTKAPEPATDEAKEAVKLIGELSGKYELTPRGTIKSIMVDSSSLKDESFDLFARQSDMTVLHVLNFRELNDAMVEKLSGLKNVENLRLINSGISDESVKTIVRSFPSLKVLDLSSNTLLTDTALKEVAKLKELRQLTINYCDFSEFGMMDISGMPNLEVLDIRANMQVGNSGLGFLAKLPRLKSLKHRSPAVDDFGLEALAESKTLETLEIQDFNITDASGQHIKRFGALTYLNIFRCQGFGSSGLLELKGMKLNRLDLRDLPSVDDMGMELFRELTGLRRLFLTELESVSNAGMINLVYLKDLTVLSIKEVPISDASLETIAKLSNLRDLSLISTKITDISVDHLLSIPKLERLNLENNAGLTESGRKRLEDSGKFKHLDFGIGRN